MYIREKIKWNESYVIEFYIVDNNTGWETEIKIGSFNFKWNEGIIFDKEVKKIETLRNKIWRKYPDTSLNSNEAKIIRDAINEGKKEMKKQEIIWEYEQIARELKSDWNTNQQSELTLQKLFNRAREIEKYFNENNMEDHIIMA